MNTWEKVDDWVRCTTHWDLGHHYAVWNVSIGLTHQTTVEVVLHSTFTVMQVVNFFLIVIISRSREECHAHFQNGYDANSVGWVQWIEQQNICNVFYNSKHFCWHHVEHLILNVVNFYLVYFSFRMFLQNFHLCHFFDNMWVSVLFNSNFYQLISEIYVDFFNFVDLSFHNISLVVNVHWEQYLKHSLQYHFWIDVHFFIFNPFVNHVNGELDSLLDHVSNVTHARCVHPNGHGYSEFQMEHKFSINFAH